MQNTDLGKPSVSADEQLSQGEAKKQNDETKVSAEAQKLIDSSHIKSSELAEKLVKIGVENYCLGAFSDDFASFPEKTLRVIYEKEKQKIIDQETSELNAYLRGSVITDMEFALRLKKLNIPQTHVRFFRNEDSVMTTEQLWAKIRKKETPKD